MGWTFMCERPSSADAYFREQLSDGYTVLASATVNLSEYYAATRELSTGTVDCFVALIQWSRSGFGYKDMSESMGPTICNAPSRVLDVLSPLPDCNHDEQYCQHCNAHITLAEDGYWWSHAKQHQVPEVTSPRCYSGYTISARTADGGHPWHAPGGTAPCSTCYARNWRQRCRENIDRRNDRRSLLTDGATVRLCHAARYGLPDEIKVNPTFTVRKNGRQTIFAWTGNPHARFRFGRTAEWESPHSSSRLAS